MEFKSQICTSRSQSEKLLALGLKPETADMSWIFSYHWECYVGNPEELYTPDEDGCDDVYIPAWSLHRLIEMSAVKDGLIMMNVAMPIELIFYDEVVNTIENLIKDNLFNPQFLEEKK